MNYLFLAINSYNRLYSIYILIFLNIIAQMPKQILKTILRLKTISVYGISQLIAPLTQIVISLFIIRYHSTQLWGEYVQLLVWINFALIFVSFGSRDFLLKKFSETPAKVFQLWLTNILSRALFLLPILLLLFLVPLDFKIQIVLIIWLITNFINNSFQVLVLYNRDFKASIAIEGTLNLLLIILMILITGSLDLFVFLILVICTGLLKSFSYILFYLKKLKGLKFHFSLADLALSISFFIPILAGTIRSKIDLYYASVLFGTIELGQYQVFISFLSLAPLAATFFINPYLKSFFRISGQTLRLIQKQSILFGIGSALIFILLVWYFINQFYRIQFPVSFYLLGFLFMLPVFLHVLLINEFYKYHKQKVVASIAFIVLIVQLFAGNILIREYGMQGALYIKIGGMWLILILLLVFRKYYFSNQAVV